MSIGTARSGRFVGACSAGRLTDRLSRRARTLGRENDRGGDVEKRAMPREAWKASKSGAVLRPAVYLGRV